MLVEKLKNELLVARKTHDELKKNILQTVLGDVQSEDARSGFIAEEKVEKILRKMIASNQETMEVLKTRPELGTRDALEKLGRENEVLDAFLPKTMTVDEIETFFMNDASEARKEICEAKSDGQATGIAFNYPSRKGRGLTPNPKVESYGRLKTPYQSNL